MTVAIYLLHTLRTEIPLSYHFHLYLCRLNAVSLANHRTEGAVSREVAVARHQQVTKIDAVCNVTIDGVYHFQESGHLLYGVGYQHSLEVVAELQTVTDAGGNGVDILQHGAVFDADDVGRGLSLDVFTGQYLGKSFCLFSLVS